MSGETTRERYRRLQQGTERAPAGVAEPQPPARFVPGGDVGAWVAGEVERMSEAARLLGHSPEDLRAALELIGGARGR